jgi:drug/metabolite transporter (DMT)-like permease
MNQETIKTHALTAAAMTAFAANSLLCRLALGAGLTDAASFATLRVSSGAVMLLALALPSWLRSGRPAVDPLSVLSLFAYMILFAFAYLTLSAGTGALLLFGAVQLTMFVTAIRAGERFRPVAWFGLALAFSGLVYLVAPGVTSPDPVGAALMAGAGIAWGVYSLRGRGVGNPLSATANNFLFCIPLCLVVSLLFMDRWHLTAMGVAWAILSGAVASGLGYVVWYAALKGLSAASAATVQLSVPVIAALGGVALLGEPLTYRIVLSSAAVLGGIALVLIQRQRQSERLKAALNRD